MRLKRNIGVAVLVAGLLVCGTSAALRDKADGSSSTIRVCTNLVMVPVSVTDPSGNVIRDLYAEDFHIEENGRHESVAKVVEPGETPLALALLIDIFGSVAARFEFERDAAERFLRTAWRPGDTLSVFSIGPEPQLVQPTTSQLSAALNQIQTASETSASISTFHGFARSAALRLHLLFH